MVTVNELAKKLHMKPSTLGVKLWAAKIEPSDYRMDDRRRAVKNFDAKAVAAIMAHFKKNPVRRKLGRPRKTQGRRKP